MIKITTNMSRLHVVPANDTATTIIFILFMRISASSHDQCQYEFHYHYPS